MPPAGKAGCDLATAGCPDSPFAKTSVKNHPITLLAVACTAGLALGYGAGRANQKPRPAADSAQTGPGATLPPPATSPNPKGSSGTAGLNLAKLLAAADSTRSSETLESLKAGEERDLYPRLALWLLHASKEDIANYWKHRSSKKDGDGNISILIFLHWTRLDPEGATAAVKGTPAEFHAWQARACHDPDAALAAARAGAPDCLRFVAEGIGLYRQAWLIANYEKLPEDIRQSALTGLAIAPGYEDSAGTLAFLEQRRLGIPEGLIKSMIERDPWKTYDWLLKNDGDVLATYGTANLLPGFIEQVSRLHPEMLERLAANTPPGGVRRQIEGKIFQDLLDSDPERALQAARESAIPLVAAQRLALSGSKLATTDGEKAFAVAAELLKIDPALLWQRPMGMDSQGSIRFGMIEPHSHALAKFTEQLMTLDPGRTLTLLEGPASSDHYERLARDWAKRDVAAYDEWLGQQSQPPQQAITPLVIALNEQGRHEDAAKWAVQMEQPESQLRLTLLKWSRSQPQEARAWADSAKLPPELREKLESSLLKKP